MQATAYRSADEVARLGSELYNRSIRAALPQVDLGKFIAVDVDSGEYETDCNDMTAVDRLRQRRPGAEVWLARVGEPAAYRLRSIQ